MNRNVWFMYGWENLFALWLIAFLMFSFKSLYFDTIIFFRDTHTCMLAYHMDVGDGNGTFFSYDSENVLFVVCHTFASIVQENADAELYTFFSSFNDSTKNVVFCIIKANWAIVLHAFDTFLFFSAKDEEFWNIYSSTSTSLDFSNDTIHIFAPCVICLVNIVYLVFVMHRNVKHFKCFYK